MIRLIYILFMFFIFESCSEHTERINKKIKKANSEIENVINQEPIKKIEKEDFGNRKWSDSIQIRK